MTDFQKRIVDRYGSLEPESQEAITIKQIESDGWVLSMDLEDDWNFVANINDVHVGYLLYFIPWSNFAAISDMHCRERGYILCDICETFADLQRLTRHIHVYKRPENT